MLFFYHCRSHHVSVLSDSPIGIVPSHVFSSFPNLGTVYELCALILCHVCRLFSDGMINLIEPYAFAYSPLNAMSVLLDLFLFEDADF